MSYTTALAITPDRRPQALLEFRNSHGWAPSIWGRLMKHLGLGDSYWDEGGLDKLWQSIETMPEWQQAPLVLTFDTGVIPWQAFTWAADQLDEFDRRLPVPENHVNHVPAMAKLLRTSIEAPLFGVWSTSVTENPFDPWDEDADAPGSGVPLYGGMYVLERHRHLLPAPSDASA